MESKKYLLGLDVGTDSVGWCLVDENHNIIKKQGKSLWGARLFEEAEDCKGRRGFRSARRRLERRKFRLDLLQRIFAEEVNKVDKNFFTRLNYSFFLPEDKPSELQDIRSVIFDKDKSFYDKYPTIYHLRKALVENSNEKFDIRLVYLAIHHIIKYRGNFLHAGNNFNASSLDSVVEAFENIDSALGALEKGLLFGDCNKVANDFMNVKDNKYRTITINKEILETAIGKNGDNGDNKYNKEIIKLISGGSCSFQTLLEDEDLEKKSFQISDDNYDETLSIFVGKGEEYATILENAKTIYDALSLKLIIGNNETISDAMIDRYNVHKTQLAELKKFVKENYSSETYDKVFKTYGDKLNNYAKYVGRTYVNKKKLTFEHCLASDFYKFLKSELKLEEKAKTNETASKILDEISSQSYLLRQNDKGNGVIPYQLNQNELILILKNQSNFYPFLNQYLDYRKLFSEEKCKEYNVDKNQPVLIKDAILSLLTFKVPYYVGPLVSTLAKDKYQDGNNELFPNRFSWSARKIEGVKIFPWNFNDIIDRDESASRFIARMLNKCSFIHDKNCLAKGSIYFGLFSVLQDLNNLVFNTKKDVYAEPRGFTYEEKQQLIEKYYMVNKSPKIKTLKEAIKNIFNVDFVELHTRGNGEDSDFDLLGNLSSLIDFKKVFKDDSKCSYIWKNIDSIELIIRDITTFEDKSILIDRLTCKENGLNFYNLKLSEEQIKSIKSFNFKKYASFSKELLLLKPIEYDENSGEVKEIGDTVLDAMYKNNVTLNEVLFDKKGLKGYALALKMANNEDGEFDFKNYDSVLKYVNEMQGTSAIKRGILQATGIIRELEKIIHHDIDEFYIESTRGNLDDKKGKTKSRKDMLLEKYSEFKKNDEYKELIKALEEIDNSTLLSKKIFHYFMQLGKDAYSGEPIDLNELDKYDIDHIIPQSLVKDDSFENTVLVLKATNNDKQDSYPIPEGFLTQKGKDNLEFLKAHHFMSEKKMKRIIRKEPLSIEELKDFVNRQIVFTAQTVSGIYNLLKDFKPNAKVYYTKPTLAHNYRNEFGLYKSRLANNFHHAHDAYLNVVLGSIAYKYYGLKFAGKEDQNSDNLDDEELKNFNVEKYFTYNKNYVLKDLDNNVYYDSIVDNEKIAHNIKTRFDIMVTDRTDLAYGAFYDQMLVKKAKNKTPIKSSNEALKNTEKYGGYDSNKSYGFTIEASKGGHKLIQLTNLHDKDFKGKLILPLKTILNRRGSLMEINGVSGNSYYISKAFEMHFDYQIYLIIRKIEKIAKIISDNKIKNIKFDEKLTFDEINKKYIEDVKKSNTKFKIFDDKIAINDANNDQSYLFVSEMNELIKYLFKFVNDNSKLFQGFSSIFNIYTDPNAIEKCLNLPIGIKLYEINQLILLLQRKRINADLTFIGFSKYSGSTLISQNLEKGDEFIAYSITGFYRKVIYKVE